MLVNDFQLKISGIYNSIMSQFNRNDGFTYSIEKGVFIDRGGFCVGIDLGNYGRDITDLKKVIEDDLLNGIDFIGGWLDSETKSYIFDAVMLYDSKELALIAAKENNQKAIYNLDTKELIYLNTPIKQTFFNNIAKEFDTHVRQSIPLFGELIEDLQENLLYYHNVLPMEQSKKVSILDLCGSTGYFGYRMHRQGFKGSYYNLDGSPKMIAISKEFEKEATNMHSILGGFLSSWIDEDGTEIKEIDINKIKNNKFTFGLEILGFQFFTKDRVKEIKELKNNCEYCVFIEKFSQTDNKLFEANEDLKDSLHKSKYFSIEELQTKRDAVLYDMHDYLYNKDSFISLLNDMFENVKPIYKAGNFAGFICSDSSLKWYKGKKELINNEFNA